MREGAVALTHRRDHQLVAQVLREGRRRVVRPAPVVLVALHRRTGRRRFLRHDDVVHRRRIAQRRRGRVGVFLEEWIRRERLVHLLREFERRHLEELQRLLDLRRERQVLTEP